MLILEVMADVFIAADAAIGQTGVQRGTEGKSLDFRAAVFLQMFNIQVFDGIIYMYLVN